MGFGTEQDRLMLDYLLGRLTVEDRLRVEEAYFLDDASMARLEFLEDRLIDEYVNRELSPRDRADYESHFLASPRRLEKARLSQALRLAALRDKHRSARTSFWEFLLRPGFRTLALASASILLVCGWWIAIQSRSELARVREALARQQRQPEPAPARPVAAFLLYPGLSRGTAATGRLSIPRTTGLQVRFQLELPEAAPPPPYVVSLRTEDGNVLWSGQLDQSTAGTVTAAIDGALLAEGDYLFVLETAPPVRRLASYPLSLLKP